MVLILPELLTLAGLLTALGLITLAVVLVAALFQVADTTVSWIPWLGKKASGGLRATEKRLNSRLSAYALGVQGAISDSWHLTANLVEQTGQAIWEATQVGAHALWLVEVKYPLAALSFLAHKGVQAAGVGAKVTNVTVQKVYRTAGVTKAQLTRLDHRLDALEDRVKAVAIAVPGAIALPFPRIGALERAGHATKARVGKLERRFGRKAFAASVATALGVLGLSWTRRTCAKRNNELLCKTDFGALEALLAGAVLAIGAQSVVRFAEGMLAVEDEMVGVLERMVVELGDTAG